MHRALARLLRCLLIVPFALAAPDTPVGATLAPEVSRVILLIGDGFGPAYTTLAREVGGAPLALDSIRVGAAHTAAIDHNITDSGAGATALASGVRTRLRSIGVDAEGHAVRTLLEAARDRGRSTGLVATSRITHATPACFAAHVRERGEEDAIAEQMLAARVDVMLGGGARHFLPGARRDGRDLVAAARARGTTVVRDLAGLRGAGEGPLLGLFADSHLDYVLDRDTTRTPSLEVMTEVALGRLARDPDGFFLMVEGSRIDHAGHANDPAAAAQEALEFDRTVARVLAFAARDGRTLVVVTADHETGGLALGARSGDRSPYDWDPGVLRRVTRSAERIAAEIGAGGDPAAVLRERAGWQELTAAERAAIAGATGEARTVAVAHQVSARAGIGWTTLGHTAVDVPVWAYGPGATHFRGAYHLSELGRRIAMLAATPIGQRAAAPLGGGE